MSRNSLLLLFWVLLLSYMLLLNFHMPLFADDYCYSGNYNNFQGVFHATYLMWISWSGRFTNIFLLYLLLWHNTVGLDIFNVINSFLFCALIYVMFLLAYFRKPSKRHDIFNLIFILALVWFTTDTLAEVAFWKSGSLTYLWSLSLTLFFIYPYRELLRGKVLFKDSWCVVVLFALVAFLLAGFLESVSAPIIVFLLGVVGYGYYKKLPLPKWAVIAIPCYILGFILLMIAPGNYGREKIFLQANHLVHDQSLFLKFIPFSITMFEHLKPFLILSVIFLILRFGFNFKKMLTAKNYWLFMALGFISAYAMLAAPLINFDGRTTFVSSVFMMIAVASLLPSADKPMVFLPKPIVFVAALVLAIITIHDMQKTYRMYVVLYEQQNLRSQLIAEQIKMGHLNILLPPFYIAHEVNTYETNVNKRRIYVTDINRDPNSWGNQCVSKYYGINSVALSPLNSVH